MRTPRASSTSALPAFDETARLPCLATEIPHAAATIAEAVEMLNVCSPSPPVPQVSSKGPVTFGWIDSPCLRSERAAAAISSDDSPFMRSPTTKAAICAGVASPERIASIAASTSRGDKSLPATSALIASPITVSHPRQATTANSR